nr:hypothetical protein [Tanacetum cinerariifolium]
ISGSSSRELLEKPEHLSHPAIDLISLLENEGKVLNNFPIFVGILIAEFAVKGADIVAEFYGPSWWKELSKESGSKILLCGDGSCWKAFKPIASLIA